MQNIKTEKQSDYDFLGLEPLVREVRLLSELYWDIEHLLCKKDDRSKEEKLAFIASATEEKAQELYRKYHEAYANRKRDRNAEKQNVVAIRENTNE